jgi:hypothetical protein
MMDKVQKVATLARFNLDFRFSQRRLKSTDVSDEHSSACCLLRAILLFALLADREFQRTKRCCIPEQRTLHSIV